MFHIFVNVFDDILAIFAFLYIFIGLSFAIRGRMGGRAATVVVQSSSSVVSFLW